MKVPTMSNIEILLTLLIEEVRGLRTAVEAINTTTPSENGTLPYEVDVEDPQ